MPDEVKKAKKKMDRARMKVILRDWGVIAEPQLCRPLRSLTPDEVESLRERVTALPHGAQRIAVPA